MKLNTLLIAVAASLATVCLSPGAYAQAPAAPKAEKAMAMSADDMLRLLDKNGDGVIDRDEAKADPMIDKNFTAINKSGSGKISRDELDTYMAKK